MKLQLLWTDECFLFILVITALCVLRGLKRPHIRRAFTQVLQQPIAISSALILISFLSIGVLDSIRFNDEKSQVAYSLLDQILAPLDTHYEKTYSAPFALTLYASETRLGNGHATKVWPRLNYPPPGLQNSKDVIHLVQQVVIKAVVLAIGLIILLILAMCVIQYLLRKKPLIKTGSAAISAYITLFFLIIVMAAGFWLSRYLHVLGTGKIGQDIFYYAVKSIRTGLIIGLLTTLFMLPLALLLGVAAGYFGGLMDDVIQYTYTTLSSIPGVLLITASVLSMQTYIANHPDQFATLSQRADARLLALCFILGITSWTSLCRLLRAETLKLREIDFVSAAKVLGSSSFTILRKHLLPNVMHIVIITVVLDFSFLVLAEAVLSYVGVGVSPLTISWGNMINAARLELAREPVVWWPMLAAFIFMFVLVLASNLFADAVRDAFDPRRVELI